MTAFGGSMLVNLIGRVAAAVALLVALVVGAVGLGAPAGAQEYGAVCSVAAEYDDETGLLRVVGTGVEPGFTTPIVLDGETIGDATADAEGNFEVFLPVELDDIGTTTYVVSILCNDDGDQSSTTVTTSVGGRVVHVIDPDTIDCAGNLRGFVVGARPGTDVIFTHDPSGQSVTVEADATGRASYHLVVDVAPGSYEITARGQDGLGDPFETSDSFTAPTGCDGPLPRTGTDSMALVFTGLAAVGLGSLTLLVARRRSAAA